MTEHAFAPYVRILGRGRKAARSLTFEEAYKAMSMILANKVEPEQLGAFLMLLRIKEESPEELAGFAKASREYIQRPAQALANLDWPSYAGKKSGASLYILSMLLLADNGFSILVHGSRGHTEGRQYTQDIFSHLGLPIASSLDDAAHLLDRHSLCYLPLANFCGPLENIMHLRNLFGLRSPVHSFAKLTNPGRCDAMLIPTFHPSYKPVHQEAAIILGEKNMAVFKGDSGEAQRRPQAILGVDALKGGEPVQEKWPAMGSEQPMESVGNSMETLIGIWRGQEQHQLYDNTIIGTCALALHTCESSLSQAESLEKARLMWTNRNRHLL